LPIPKKVWLRGGISAGNFEFHLQLTAGCYSQGILQQAEVIVLKPDLAEFVGHFQVTWLGSIALARNGANHML